jgi:hypothetical protein
VVIVVTKPKQLENDLPKQLMTWVVAYILKDIWRIA